MSRSARGGVKRGPDRETVTRSPRSPLGITCSLRFTYIHPLQHYGFYHVYHRQRPALEHLSSRPDLRRRPPPAHLAAHPGAIPQERSDPFPACRRQEPPALHGAAVPASSGPVLSPFLHGLPRPGGRAWCLDGRRPGGRSGEQPGRPPGGGRVRG